MIGKILGKAIALPVRAVGLGLRTGAAAAELITGDDEHEGLLTDRPLHKHAADLARDIERATEEALDE